MNRVNKDEDGDFDQVGVDAYKTLLKSRIILLNGDIRESIIEKVAVPLIRMTEDKPKKPIQILINSYGGSMEDSQAVIDIMRSTRTPIITKVLGKAMSAAFDIFLAGDTRIMYPGALLMCHSGGTAAAYKPLPHFDIEAKLHQELYKRWSDFYASRTNISAKEWLELITSGKDRYFMAKEALQRGLCTQVYPILKK